MNKQKIIKETTSISLIIFFVLLFRSTFFEPFKIPSGSMIPTLLIGDFILVNKFSYGLKLPFSEWAENPVYLTGPAKPERGDVVVFKYPKNTSLNYIKRVVALPGDRIEIVDKVVYVNGEEIKTKPLEANKFMDMMDEKFKIYNFEFFESETGNSNHVIQHNIDSYYTSDMGETVVPHDMYFVMGDNRDFSSDSRVWGFVPFKYVKGKAILVWFSMNIPWPWSEDDDYFSFRPGRIGSLIK
jgi:signal peptidase I